jgi:hypothetical protein
MDFIVDDFIVSVDTNKSAAPIHVFQLQSVARGISPVSAKNQCRGRLPGNPAHSPIELPR